MQSFSLIFQEPLSFENGFSAQDVSAFIHPKQNRPGLSTVLIIVSWFFLNFNQRPYKPYRLSKRRVLAPLTIARLPILRLIERMGVLGKLKIGLRCAAVTRRWRRLFPA
jgi:hypothetical protein